MNQNFYNSNSLGFDQSQPPQFPVIHQPRQEMSIQEIEDLKQQYLDEMKRLINFEYRDEIKIDELKGNFNSMGIEINKKEKFQQLEQVANLSTYPSKHFNSFHYDDDDDDEEDYTIAVTPSLSTEELDNSLSIGDEHLDTTLATKSDEFNKTSVENLIPIPSESEGIPDNMCDVPFHDNSPPLDVSKDQFEDFSNSNDEFSSTDDDSFSIDNIDYVKVSPPYSELVNSEVMEIVIPEVEGIDDDLLLTIKDDILREKLLNINLLIAKIKALNDNPTPFSDFMTKSSSTSLNSLLKETNSFDNSLPEFETFCFDLKEISSGSTTTRFDISLPKYEAFYDDHVKEISSVGIRRVVPRNYNPKRERFLIASRFPTPPLACAFFSLRATETSSLKLARNQTSNLTSSANPTPKGQIRRSSKQKVENSHFEEHLTPVATMTDNRTMVEMLRAPIEGCAEAIIVPPILAEKFALKHSLINMMTSEQFFGLEKDNPHDYVWAARRWLEKEPSRSITTWDDLVSKFINEFFPPSRTTNLRNEISNFQQKFDESFHEAWERYKDLIRACPHHGFTKLHQLDTFYNALNPADQDSLNAAAVNACDNHSSYELAKLTHAVNQQTSVVTTAMTAMLKQFQLNPPPTQVKAVEEIYVTCGGAHLYYQCLAADGNTFPEFRDNIQGYVSAATGNYNQGNPGYRPQGVANQMRPPGFAQPNVQNNQNRFGKPQGFNHGPNFNQEQPYQATAQSNQNLHLNELEKIKRMNDVSLKSMQNQIDMVKNELRNEMKTFIQTSLSNQTNEIKNMMASLLKMNTASTSGSGTLPGNSIANPKGKIKVITTRSGLATDGPTVPNPLKSVNPEEDECVEQTYTDPDHAKYTMKVLPPPPVQKPKPPVQRNFVLHTRDSLPPHIMYPSRMLKQKQQEIDDIQIQKFWNMFKQLHLNITLAEALVLMPKYQKMLKALLFNKEKLQELANTPLNENCSAVILKKLPEKLGDPGKFLIPCGFSELKCKALANLGASINLMPLSVWKKLGLPDLIPTQMTLELANRAIFTPDGIARDVFVPVGKFTFPADFVVVDYESDSRVPLILGRPFLRTARALIDVHDEEMILRDGDERLTLNMKHDTASYSNHPHRESVNLINIFNLQREDYLEDLVSHKQSGNPTYSLHKEIASPEVIHEFHDSKGCTFLSRELPDTDSFNDIHPHFDDDPLSGSTTYSSNSLLEEFVDELALITYPLDYDDNRACDIKSDIREIEFLLYQGEDFDFKDSIDQSDLTNRDDLFVDPTPEMFTDEQPPYYSFPLRFDVYPNDFLEIESDADTFDNDSFDSKGEKIKEAELLIDQLDLPCDILSEYDSFNSQDFSRDDDLPSPDNKDKVFNPGILIHEKSVKIITRVAQEKKLAISFASWLFEDFDPPFYELLVFKEVPNLMRLLLFSSENEEKVFKPGIYTSKKVFETKGPWVPILVSVRCQKPGHLAARLECAETKVATWDDLAFKIMPFGLNVKHLNVFCKDADLKLKF
uniref:Retrotransposon gag domain-containing protein n=1 Tax=Tanacetum cinerariifolium TaxID=118510 RepID=A0A6L2K9Z2_TANCI|nr:hypothetical protein [Tanacetum cinerariifolium]